MRLCNHCRAPLPRDKYLCITGQDALLRILSRVRDVLNTAGATLTKQAVTPVNRGGMKGSSNPDAPLGVDMQEQAWRYRESIGYWTRHVARACGGPAPVDVLNRAHWLSERIPSSPKRPGIIGYEWAPDMLHCLADAERRIVAAADRPAARIMLGRCDKADPADPAETGGRKHCQGMVIGQEGETLATCNRCASRYSVHARREAALAGAWQILAPLPRVVKALNAAGHPLKYDTAKKWVARGKLAPQCDLRTRREGVSIAAVHALLTRKPTVSG